MSNADGKPRVWEWTPLDLVREATDKKAASDFAAYCSAPYLLVIPDPIGEFARAAAPKETFETEMCDPDHVTPMPRPMGSAEARGVSSERAAALPLCERLQLQRCHVIPIRPRRAGAGPRVNVGRTAEQDVVISHRSVSKVHACFELESNGQIYVRDLNSTNHSFVNGVRIMRPVEVHPGCVVRFGSVETHLYRPQSLWDVFHP